MPIATYAIHHRTPSPDGALAPIGSRAEVLAALAVCNTGPDRPGGDTLFGPGFQIHLLAGEDPIRQMSLTITEPDIAWDVIERLRHQQGWRFTDLESGDTW